jgi:arylsulfatase A-like enzyme
MTGRYPLRCGLQVSVVRPWAEYGLPLEERTLPQALREVGYETAIVGKWHLGHFRPQYLPTRRGFDHQYGHYNGALDYFTHVRDGGFDWHRDDRENRDEGYTTHLLAREAVRRIQQRDPAKPLFLYVPFNAVHGPHQVPPRYEEPYARLEQPRRAYAGMTAALDEAVGQIADAIDAAGMRENTLFVFSSDNGGPDPGRTSSNGPLRAGKGTIYEGGVRACAFATWHNRIKPATLVQAPVHMVDWYPTLLKLAGASLDQSLAVDGRDQWATIVDGAPSAHEEIVINSAPQHGAIRMGNWKLVLNGHLNVAVAEARFAEHFPIERVELFDLAGDPGEKQNLADSRPQIVARLQARYDEIAGQAVPPRSRPKPRAFRSPKTWGESTKAD